MSDQWFFTRGDQQQGPIPLAQLQSMVASGQVARNELAWRTGLPQWTPVGSIPELVSSSVPIPPPMPTGMARPPMATLPIGYASPMPPLPGIGENEGVRWLIPVGRSGWAIAAGYFGLFGLFGGFLAPLAIIFSVIAMRDIKSHPNRHGMGRAIFGLIAGILGTVMLAVVLIGMAGRAR